MKSLLITAYLCDRKCKKGLVCRFLFFSAQDFLNVTTLLSAVKSSVEFHVETSHLFCSALQNK